MADGDNAYLLVDSAGRIIVTGPVASDGVATGNPLSIGGDVDDTSPAAAAEGDRRVFRSTPEGNQIVELYKDNNALLPFAAMPGASEVISKVLRVNNSTARTEVAAPASGKKIRMIAVTVDKSGGTTVTTAEVYFGTGAGITTTAAKAIAEGLVDDTLPALVHSWPDGAGPVGAADDVLSVRSGASGIGEEITIVATYREE